MSKTMVSLDNFEEKLKQLIAELFPLKNKPIKLIIHAGTPKTGTTSLQVYLAKKKRKLQKTGLLYPSHSHNKNAPQHQWLEKNLVRIHPQNLYDNFENILRQTDNETHSILLSSEGVYNHWWDFSEDAKNLLKALNNCFEIKIWVWFREPLAFAESFYKQCMRNPAVSNISCYGKNLSFAEILQDPWFVKHLDYLSFINECNELFGKTSITVFEYQQDTVQTVSKLLGLATPHDNPTPRKNTSMNALTTDLYRIINTLELPAKDKEKFVPYLQNINLELAPYDNKNTHSLIDSKSKALILEMTTETMTTLKKHYHTKVS